MKKIFNNEFPIIAIVAMTKNFIIGDGFKMLWHLPEDLKRLKKITMGNPLIMGRKTYESIGKPLPGRANIILSRNLAADKSSGLKFVVNDFTQSIIRANMWINENFEHRDRKNKSIFIFGGGEIYNLAIDYCIRIEMTLIDLELNKGIYFPKLNLSKWKKKLIGCVEENGSSPAYSYWRYERIK